MTHAFREGLAPQYEEPGDLGQPIIVDSDAYQREVILEADLTWKLPVDAPMPVMAREYIARQLEVLLKHISHGLPLTELHPSGQIIFRRVQTLQLEAAGGFEHSFPHVGSVHRCLVQIVTDLVPEAQGALPTYVPLADQSLEEMVNERLAQRRWSFTGLLRTVFLGGPSDAEKHCVENKIWSERMDRQKAHDAAQASTLLAAIKPFLPAMMSAAHREYARMTHKTMTLVREIGLPVSLVSFTIRASRIEGLPLVIGGRACVLTLDQRECGIHFEDTVAGKRETYFAPRGTSRTFGSGHPLAGVTIDYAGASPRVRFSSGNCSVIRKDMRFEDIEFTEWQGGRSPHNPEQGIQEA